MVRFPHVFLAFTSLSASALGAALSTPQPVGFQELRRATPHADEETQMPSSASYHTRRTSSPGDCMEGDLRCNGVWEEMCNSAGQWEQLQGCTRCVDDSNRVDCVGAATNPPPEPASHHHHCHDGDLQCNGDFLEICYQDRHWHRLVPCRGCTRSDDGGILCPGGGAAPSALPA
ncbi:hypothetical protein F5Y05DRAFT_244943 [Hypoxylon sp. FL0543]|nr:hypothetical protein F5Y05DRAFT_244943 [Hypoxylon sp. FL0543]